MPWEVILVPPLSWRQGLAQLMLLTLVGACGSGVGNSSDVVVQPAVASAQGDVVVYGTDDSVIHILGEPGGTRDVQPAGWSHVSDIVVGPRAVTWAAVAQDGESRYYFSDYRSQRLSSVPAGNVAQVHAQGDTFIGLNTRSSLVRFTLNGGSVSSSIEPVQGSYAFSGLAPTLLGTNSTKVFIALSADGRLHLGGPSEVVSVSRDGSVAHEALSDATRLVAAYRGAVTTKGIVVAEGTATAEEPCGHELTTDLLSPDAPLSI